MTAPTSASGPDLRQGISIDSVPVGELTLGHVEEEPVLLAHTDRGWFAVGGSCTHYGVSLAGGLVVDGTVRCPAHHAVFDLRSGEALGPPAFRPLPCWEVVVEGSLVRVRGRREPAPRPAVRASRDGPEAVVIVGAGAAGTAAALELRRQGYAGRLTLLGAEKTAPYDRPNVSKDFLAGSAPEAWMPLHDEHLYRDQGIDLQLGTRVSRVDLAARTVTTLPGEVHGFDRLLLATGADPIRLPIATHALPHVHYLRTLEDARRVIAGLETAARVVVIGASFVGLEAAAALRARGVEVTVVAPHRHPLERVLGPEVGDFIRSLHEERGVRFQLEDEAVAITREHVALRSGARLPADLVVVGIGVRPGVGLASWARLALHEGALAVDRFLETSAPGVFGAGDLVAWPDPRTGSRIRSEHWVVAQRQGQTAARNLLGAGESFDAVPFFWSAHYDTTIRYVGHAERWDRIDLQGSLAEADCSLAFRAAGAGGEERTLAVATIGRDRDALRAELALEHADWDALDSPVPAPAVPHA